MNLVKKISVLAIGLCLGLSLQAQVDLQSLPKREFRAAWLTTVWAIDWPSSRGVTASHQTAQKKEMTAYLDLMAEMKMTSVWNGMPSTE